jgi:hypothetical protein
MLHLVSSTPVIPPETPARQHGPVAVLRRELADLAFTLERQGRRDAADVVMQVYARLDELAGEPAADGFTRNFSADSNDH